MKKNYYLFFLIIVLTISFFPLFAGNKHPGAKKKHPGKTQIARTPQPESPFIDSDDDDYTPPPPPSTPARRRRAAILQDDTEERIQALQAQIVDLRSAVAAALEKTSQRGQKIDKIAPKAEQLRITAEKLESAAQEAKKQVKIGFSGPLNDIFNGGSFALATIFYGTLLYDEYMSLENDGIKSANGFFRFALQRFCQFKWSLTEAARVVWVAIIAKIICDYYG